MKHIGFGLVVGLIMSGLFLAAGFSSLPVGAATNMALFAQATYGAPTAAPVVPTQVPGGAASPTSAVPSAGTTPGASANCTNVATFVTDVTIPDNTGIAPGQTFTKTWRIRNRGTCTWGTGYTFTFVSGQAMTPNTSIPIPNTAPGATADVSIPMTAPTTAGTVRGNWQMKAPNGAAVGPLVWVIVRVGSVSNPAAAPTVGEASPTPSATTSASAACTNVATFVADVTIPDNSPVAPGQEFTKTWRLRNRGTCTWGTGYTFNLVAGPALTSATSVPVPTTAPGATVDISVPMTATTTVATEQDFWQLRAPNGVAFGPRVWVLVRVGGALAPAAAPPLVAAANNLDDPAKAMALGTPIQNLAPHSGEWFEFPYDNGGGLPRPTVTIRLVNGVTNGLRFEVWSPERMQGNWFDNVPVGKGTQEKIVDCSSASPAFDANGNLIPGSNQCTTNDLMWTGGFGLSGTYWVRVVNDSDHPVAPQLIIGGPGLVGCSNVPLPNLNHGTAPFAMTTCQSPTGSILVP